MRKREKTTEKKYAKVLKIEIHEFYKTHLLNDVPSPGETAGVLRLGVIDVEYENRAHIHPIDYVVEITAQAMTNAQSERVFLVVQAKRVAAMETKTIVVLQGRFHVPGATFWTFVCPRVGANVLV